MAFRNDHEAALRRAAALEADLKAEQRAEADKDQRIAALEHELGDARAALARAGVAVPASAVTSRTWADVSAQLDDYLAQSKLADSRSMVRRLAPVGGTVVMLITSLVFLAAGIKSMWLIPGIAIVAAVAIFVSGGYLYRPTASVPLRCPTCRLEIVGAAESDHIKLVRSLHRCPHCQAALCVD